MIRVGNVKNEVNAKLEVFQRTLEILSKGIDQLTNKTDSDILEMKKLLNEEMRDMRSANQAF